ncbi:hypothetical protein AUK40_03075 [Candidatus Wirthbacteria bacterium CG2_30_54_11]|uniref:Peptidase S24/S26A/S26B/S26C domain-containing protein n=1 Tax=Candidatus Wirthbacteria bacterium CG2_30_54_11 TaxID=1817892 RepID=A0A1J5IK74_9BACT|nr:MAG: hypothetical protein AUK40_03075 [Candidatus Wirthbacteria bacterium CG2_30_54_11]
MTRTPLDLERISEHIRGFYQERGRMPSFSELETLLGYKSKGAVRYVVDKLVELGVLSKDSQGKLIPKNLVGRYRLLGSIVAGFPSPAEEQQLSTLSFDQLLVTNPESTFVVTVQGDSMIDAGIHEGDMVVVEKGRLARTGDIVIAEIDGAWTMKYYDKQGGTVTLHPANKNYPDLHPREELSIGGVVVGVVRKYR